MIPVGDNIRLRRFPLCTWLLLLATLGAFALQVALPMADRERLVRHMGVIPVRVRDAWAAVATDPGLLAGGLRDFATVAVLPCLAYVLLHGGWVHVLGNLLFLRIFGDQIEDRLGRLRFLWFYVVCGVASAVLHLLMEPDQDVPVVGASGAIAGCLGANLVLFPKARVALLVPIVVVFTVVEIPTVVALSSWFVLQLPWVHRILGLPEVATVAYWAHVGGFAAGALFAPLFCLGTPPRRK